MPHPAYNRSGVGGGAFRNAFDEDAPIAPLQTQSGTRAPEIKAKAKLICPSCGKEAVVVTTFFRDGKQVHSCPNCRGGQEGAVA